MTAIRKEILRYIDDIPDIKLQALKPILTLLVDETLIIEADLTDEEKGIVMKGREEYKKGGFIPLNDVSSQHLSLTVDDE